MSTIKRRVRVTREVTYRAPDETYLRRLMREDAKRRWECGLWGELVMHRATIEPVEAKPKRGAK